MEISPCARLIKTDRAVYLKKLRNADLQIDPHTLCRTQLSADNECYHTHYMCRSSRTQLSADVKSVTIYTYTYCRTQLSDVEYPNQTQA